MSGLEVAVTNLLNYVYKQIDTVGTVNTAHGPLPVLLMQQFDPLIRELQEEMDILLAEQILVTASAPVAKALPPPVFVTASVAVSGVSKAAA